MENSTDDVEAHQSFRSPPRTRRSTFFERRESIAPQILSEQADTNESEIDKENERRCHDMTSYFNKLMVEKEQWKKEVNDRRNKYHDLRQQYQMAVKAPSRSSMSYSALSNDDIEFLKRKPNISKLVDSQLKFHKSIKESIALLRRANKLDEVVLNFCESKVNQITDYILENSTVDLIE